MSTARGRPPRQAFEATDLPRVARRGRFRVRVALAIRRARRLAEVDPTAFAAALRALLPAGTDDEIDLRGVTGAAVVAWESGLEDPSATILMAAAEVAGVEVEVLFHRRPVMVQLKRMEDQLRSQADQVRGLRRRLGLPMIDAERPIVHW